MRELVEECRHGAHAAEEPIPGEGVGSHHRAPRRASESLERAEPVLGRQHADPEALHALDGAGVVGCHAAAPAPRPPLHAGGGAALTDRHTR